jgi:flagellar biosynthesis/type III secretory pathway ATPase
MNQGEVARLREQIALEYQASQRVFTDFTPTAQHEYIRERQENIAAYFQDLTRYISSEEAVALIIAAENGITGESNVSL